MPGNNAMGRPPGLVIFDCDGVLVDSEPISVSVLRDVLAGAGLDMDVETAYLRFLGRSMKTITEILNSEFGLVISTDHLAHIRSEMNRRFEAELQPIPGIQIALANLHVRRCVASSSLPERIRLSLGVTGLLEMLEPSIYSSTMVKRGKPAPDLFLHAARDMGVAAADCLVIEDSPAGIEAARAAGMRVFAFSGGSHAAGSAFRQRLMALRPDLIFDDMAQLPHLVAGLSLSEAS